MQQITETELVKEVRRHGATAAVCNERRGVLCAAAPDVSVCLLHLSIIQELGRLDDDATVYKLIGPAMIKQDLLEANTNVAKRLEYIQGEVKRITNKLAELESKAKEQQQVVSKQEQKHVCVKAGAEEGGGGGLVHLPLSF